MHCSRPRLASCEAVWRAAATEPDHCVAWRRTEQRRKAAADTIAAFVHTATQIVNVAAVHTPGHNPGVEVVVVISAVRDAAALLRCIKA